MIKQKKMLSPKSWRYKEDKSRYQLSKVERIVYDNVYANYISPSNFKSLWMLMEQRKRIELMAKVGLTELN